MSESNGEKTFRITPKGVLFAAMIECGYTPSMEELEEIWLKLDAHCAREIRQKDPDAEYHAVVFDGSGGTVIGVNKRKG